MEKINRLSDKPVHAQIADQLVEAIRIGDYKPGDRLPPVWEISAATGASRYPVRQALAHLQGMGLIDIQQGIGTFVRTRQPVRRLAHKRLSREEFEAGRGGGATDFGERPDVRNLVLERGPAPLWVADLLHLRSGYEVIMRTRTIYLDDRPTQVGTSFWPAAVAAETPFERAEVVYGPWQWVLAQHRPEIVPGVIREVFTARVPLPEEAQALAISSDVGIAVFRLVQTCHAADGSGLFVDEVLMRADLYELEYEIPFS